MAATAVAGVSTRRSFNASRAFPYVLVGPGAIVVAVFTVLALAFTLFAFYGSGLEANLWSLALLAAGIIMFAIMRMRHGPSPAAEAAPAAPPE